MIILNNPVAERLAADAFAELHPTLVQDDAYCGYDGLAEQVALLLEELAVIAHDEVDPEGADPVGTLLDAWYTIQGEIAAGEREVGWFH